MSSSVLPMLIPSPSAAKVPITEKQEIRASTYLFSLANLYQLGDEQSQSGIGRNAVMVKALVKQ
jgi:hypothetical protein